jgi:hypothetical protein
MLARCALTSAAAGPARKSWKARGVVPGNMANIQALLHVKSSRFSHDAADLFVLKLMLLLILPCSLVQVQMQEFAGHGSDLAAHCLAALAVEMNVIRLVHVLVQIRQQ